MKNRKLARLIDFTEFMLTNVFTIICDNKGYIAETKINDKSEVTGIILDYLKKMIRPDTHLSSYFHLPELSTADLFPVVHGQDMFELAPLGNRKEPFQCIYDSEGIFTDLPLFCVVPFRYDATYFTATVRFTKFYRSIIQDNSVHPFMCLDHEDHILAVNRLFINEFGISPDEAHEVLGKWAGEYMNPSPGSIQAYKESLFTISDISDQKPLFETDNLKLEAKEDRYHSIIGQFENISENVIVEFTLDEGTLPCVVLGDTDPILHEFIDNQGYLLGPDAYLSSIVLKKRGRSVYDTAHSFTEWPKGRYRFCKRGNSFTIDYESKRLFSYFDYDLIIRNSTKIALFIRRGKSAIVSNLKLYVTGSETGDFQEKTFISARRRKESLFLLTPVNYFHSRTVPPHTVYKLQDFSDIKERQTEMEKAYREALQKINTTSHNESEINAENYPPVGTTKAVSKIREQAEKAAQSSASILIEGPTGSGKEVLARYIHSRSSFAKGPFVKVDCSTLPSSLMESLLFGHEKGSFTGAAEKHIGLFEQANGGTLFLDEVSNIDTTIQAKLLKFLQDNSIRPLGATIEKQLSLRIIAASNIQLTSLISRQMFRSDLYYRIAVVVLSLPPLSSRLEDLPALVDYIIKHLNAKYNRNIKGLTPQAFRKLYQYNWPGNIRELNNVLERAFLFSGTGKIAESAIEWPAVVGKIVTETRRKKSRRVNISRSEIIQLFKDNGGIALRVAEALEVTPQTLYNYLKKRNINPADLKFVTAG
ncbi:MAG: sigma-54-dependent Fis family transcriptional regulator [Fibrobacteres bacterium]|nr:sigma-54-dependent Fis family transcriptional regulator [Fibrobacterota bacterium]